jgi:hypothetical protein
MPWHVRYRIKNEFGDIQAVTKSAVILLPLSLQNRGYRAKKDIKNDLHPIKKGG